MDTNYTNICNAQYYFLFNRMVWDFYIINVSFILQMYASIMAMPLLTLNWYYVLSDIHIITYAF